MKDLIFKAEWIESPLGKLLAIADEQQLHLLDFFNRKHLQQMVERLQRQQKATLQFETASAVINSIRQELKEYFAGHLIQFKTPFKIAGSPFQKKVWGQLLKIPYGTTCSYSDLAQKIEAPSSCRAAANANGANRLALIIPCHRVINSNGKLGGYGGGVERKQWLLTHEASHQTSE